MWTVSAPSNIALIKYMGKENNPENAYEMRNIPANISLSYTTKHFFTTITIEETDSKVDVVDVIAESNTDIIGRVSDFTTTAICRFLAHLDYIKSVTGCKSKFRITSKNNFPHSTGIASSASSFAALTIGAFDAICSIQKTSVPSVQDMSAIGRMGSGSACRSFFDPMCVWEGKQAHKFEVDVGELEHEVVLIDNSAKKISSSSAHENVKTSMLFETRPSRAKKRYQLLSDAFRDMDWKSAYQICWEEFFDMHSLFETSNPHFGYITSGTLSVLADVVEFWRVHDDGPIVTVDAGPNVHLLWRLDQSDLRNMFKNDFEFQFVHTSKSSAFEI